jgi:hypothetical protein
MRGPRCDENVEKLMTKKEPPRNKKVYGRSANGYGPQRPMPPDANADEVWTRVGARFSISSA